MDARSANPRNVETSRGLRRFATALFVVAALSLGCTATDNRAPDPPRCGTPFAGDPALAKVLHEALLDEYRAAATYRKVLRQHGDVRPFANIAEAESRHAGALEALSEQYGLGVPTDPWRDSDADLPSYPTLAAACEQGIEAERENVALYDRLLDGPLPSDVRAVLEHLRGASETRHLPALERCAISGPRLPPGIL
jgi:hypothetical protein